MTRVAYVRVSSEHQNPARQFEQLNSVGVECFYQETISGATQERPELQRMLKDLKHGDEIYVTDLTRITRSTRDLFALIDTIKEKGAVIKSLKDTWLDVSEDNPYSHFLMTVIGGVNQLERDLIRMRQKEGIALAKKEGKYKGRRKKYHGSHAGMNHAIELYKEGSRTVKQICEITNVSKASLYRKLNKK
jgi:DNA invertase Pin-like site-specific DNA recombinase